MSSGSLRVVFIDGLIISGGVVKRCLLNWFSPMVLIPNILFFKTGLLAIESFI